MRVSQIDPATVGIGVLQTSEVYLNAPSDFARRALYHVYRMGDYQVDRDYIVSRLAPEKRVHSYHLFLITSGCLHFAYRDKLFSAPEGAVVLIDCMEQHEYRAAEHASFEWVWFDGPGARDYCDWLQSFGSSMFFPKDFAALSAVMLRMLRMFDAKRVNEHQVSLLLQTILCSIASLLQERTSSTSQAIGRAAQYMENHFMEPLRVEALAVQCNLSVQYFIRQFRKTLGESPYEYLMNVRLSHAKRLLLTTRMPVGEIGASVGFNSPTSFIRFFKHETDMTPHQFRVYQPEK